MRKDSAKELTTWNPGFAQEHKKRTAVNLIHHSSNQEWAQQFGYLSHATSISVSHVLITTKKNN